MLTKFRAAGTQWLAAPQVVAAGGLGPAASLQASSQAQAGHTGARVVPQTARAMPLCNNVRSFPRTHVTLWDKPSGSLKLKGDRAVMHGGVQRGRYGDDGDTLARDRPNARRPRARPGPAINIKGLPTAFA